MGISNQGELDEKTLRHISENAEVEHTLLTPFRWLIGTGKIIIYIMLAISWLLFTLVGWVVNVGEYSLENRREAVCDARAYFQVCDPYQFNSTHHPGDFLWITSQVPSGNVFNVKQIGGDPEASFEPGQSSDEEMHTPTQPWIKWSSDSSFFLRSDDVFRRKSAQMDHAIDIAAANLGRLRFAIAEARNIDKDQVRLNTPNIKVRTGLVPGDQTPYVGYHVTYGMCLQTECAPDGSDLNYYLTLWDVLFTKPALSPHQVHAVAVLNHINPLSFWLQQAHANGVHDDGMIRSHFEQAQSIIASLN